jgi:DNA-binding beta-propeller fold protein YncE
MVWCAALIVGFLHSGWVRSAPLEPVWIPTGQDITPLATPGAQLLPLRAGTATDARPLGQGVSALRSPDGTTLLVLTSGFNRTMGPTGSADLARSNEAILVYDIRAGMPTLLQVLEVPTAFLGLAFAPDGQYFYVSGGKDDCVHVFARHVAGWVAEGEPIPLLNGPGLSLTSHPDERPAPIGALTAGLAVTADGQRLIAANYEHDSLSIVDLTQRKMIQSLDLRPGKQQAEARGVPGGEFPLDVAIKGDRTVFVSSVRDREVVVVDLDAPAHVIRRIPVKGNPNRLLLDRSQKHLFVAVDNTDRVEMIDTQTLRIEAGVVTRVAATLGRDDGRPGASPNGLALSPDERTLYVTNGGENSVAVVHIDLRERELELQGALPTGWYPNAVVASSDHRFLYVVNGKSPAGPNPLNCSRILRDAPRASGCDGTLPHRAGNQYIWQLTHGSLLTLPIPDRRGLATLTQQVARNNRISTELSEKDRTTFAALRKKIEHVIYIVKENRTYDQILGDLEGAAGDRRLAQFPRVITPNLHALASDFVTLDHFYCSSEVSMDGWQWSTGGRTVDINEKTTPVYYGKRGASYDSEGTSRDINVGLATPAERAAFNPVHRQPGLDDPDLLPGIRNEMELDGPDGVPGAGYLWNAALKQGRSVRNYGFLLDLTRYAGAREHAESNDAVPLLRDPHAAGTVVAYPANADLAPYTDRYFRGFDTKFPDFYRFKEWEREFDAYSANGQLPTLSLVRLMNDHTGDFATAIDGVNTPELQQADNDYAVGRLVEKVSKSPYAGNTLIFVLEDDAQDGPDHLDAHRSPAFIVGPYVKHEGVVVSNTYTTVNMIRTIEEVLGLPPLNIHDRSAEPMTEVFDLRQHTWSFTARPSAILRHTALPLPAPTDAERADGNLAPLHDHNWWASETVGFDFSREDALDSDAFNRILWRGTMGAQPYPERRGDP